MNSVFERLHYVRPLLCCWSLDEYTLNLIKTTLETREFIRLWWLIHVR